MEFSGLSLVLKHWKRQGRVIYFGNEISIMVGRRVNGEFFMISFRPLEEKWLTFLLPWMLGSRGCVAARPPARRPPCASGYSVLPMASACSRLCLSLCSHGAQAFLFPLSFLSPLLHSCVFLFLGGRERGWDGRDFFSEYAFLKLGFRGVHHS